MSTICHKIIDEIHGIYSIQTKTTIENDFMPSLQGLYRTGLLSVLRRVCIPSPLRLPLTLFTSLILTTGVAIESCIFNPKMSANKLIARPISSLI